MRSKESREKRKEPGTCLTNPEARGQSLADARGNVRVSVQPSALRFPRFSCFFLSLLCLGLVACGHKTPVRPPEWVVPEAIGDLSLDVDDKKHVLVLRWGRPQEYADGSEMDDLGGFVVLRATQGEKGAESGFTQIATIAVTDRDRFRKAKKFTYTDSQLSPGVLYRYRVQAVTLDGYASDLSNTVELVWSEQTTAPAQPPEVQPPPAKPTKPTPAARPARPAKKR